MRSLSALSLGVVLVTFGRGTPTALADGAIEPTGAAPSIIPNSNGMVVASAPDEFIVAGMSISVTVAPRDVGKRAGLLSVEDGRYADGVRQNTRWLGGDETHQGRHVRLEPGRFSIQRVKLYSY